MKQYNDKAAQWHQAIASSPEAYAYARSRGITDASLKAWRIGYCGDTNTIMDGRLTFPIYDIAGNVVSVSGRALAKDVIPKAWHYPFEKGRYVYGLHLMTPCPFVVVVEGEIDAILVRQQGYQCVAVKGSSLSPVAAALLRLYTSCAVVYPDNIVPDEKAFEKALKWVDVLGSVGVKAAFPLRPYEDDSAGDPADLCWNQKLRRPHRPEWLREQIDAAAQSVTVEDPLEVM